MSIFPHELTCDYMSDIDGWYVRDLITPLFFNNNTELHNLIRKRVILPYLTGSFHQSFIEDCTVGLVNVTSVRNEETKLFTSTYDNFIQTAGIRDGVSHCEKILSVFHDNLDSSDPKPK